MLLDLAQLAFHNLLCILGVAEDKSSEEISSLDGGDSFAIPLEASDGCLDFGDRDPGENIALGYAGVQNGDALNQAAFAMSEAPAAD
jgi:hypothetical protein